MGFQKVVRYETGFGVQGEISHDAPVRARPAILNSTDAANNVIGSTALWDVPSDNTVAADVAKGTGAFAGILAAPKTYVSYGTQAGGPLAPTLTLPNRTTSTVVMEADMRVYVTLQAGAGNVGDQLAADNVTGALTVVGKPGTDAPAGFTLIPAWLARHRISAAGLCWIHVNNQS